MPSPAEDRPIDPSPEYREALRFLYGRIDYERARGRPRHQFRLESTASLLHELGLGAYVHRDFSAGDRPANFDGPPVPLVHIAGTKGKGSTATLISQILCSAGYRVGLYTSPHLSHVEERFRIDGQPCRPETLTELIRDVAPVARQMDAAGRRLSFFELTTAMAMLLFDRNRCDAIVLEVGLGGRLDSTNVCASSVAAITAIGLDHQHVLGDTIAEIAAEKAGIIKSPRPVVTSARQPEALQAIRDKAAEHGAPVFELGQAFEAVAEPPSMSGSAFRFRSHVSPLDGAAGRSERSFRLALEGAHQIDNAAVAIAVVRLLGQHPQPHPLNPLKVTEPQIGHALRTVRCPGRLERFTLASAPSNADPIPNADPITSESHIVVDSAHNRDSIAAMVAAATVGAWPRPRVCVFATSRDKDVSVMVAELARCFDRVICTEYTTNPRAVPAGEIAKAFEESEVVSKRPEVVVEPDPDAALSSGLDRVASGGTVVICGSFFLAGQLRPRLLALPGVRPSDAPVGDASASSPPAQCPSADAPLETR